MLEDQHEITDKAYLDEIRAGTVTYAELYCPKSRLEMRHATNLAEAINATNSLTVLNFPVTTQESGALFVLFQALSHCHKLSNLYLNIDGENVLSDSDVGSLVQIITNCTSIVRLDLSRMKISPDQQLKIVQACSQLQFLKEIWLSEWKVDAKVASALGHLLETSRTISCLWLHNCAISPNELSLLLKCLARNRKHLLDTLIVGLNPIGAVGVTALATYITSGKITVKNLDLGLTNLDDSCADSLFEIINCNSPLESLSCSNNELGFYTLTKIASAIQNNTHLTKLDLHANPFHGNQRLAAVTDMSEVPQSSAQLLQQIEAKLSSNKQYQANQHQGVEPKL